MIFSSFIALRRSGLARSRSVSTILSIDILRVSFDRARARWTSAVFRRLTISFLNLSPNSKTIWSIMCCGRPSGNVHGEIIVWLPDTRNLSWLPFGFSRLSRRVQTGQHHLDTPMICPVACIASVRFDKYLSKVTHSIFVKHLFR